MSKIKSLSFIIYRFLKKKQKRPLLMFKKYKQKTIYVYYINNYVYINQKKTL